MTRKYSTISVQSTLAVGISSTATSMTVTAATASGLVSEALTAGNVDQFAIAIDHDTVNEEIVWVTEVSVDTLTIVRGRANTSNVAHSAGASVKHVLTGEDLTFFTTKSITNCFKIIMCIFVFRIFLCYLNVVSSIPIWSTSNNPKAIYLTVVDNRSNRVAKFFIFSVSTYVYKIHIISIKI